MYVLQTAKEYCEQLGVEACIKLFEQFKSYEGLYFFLGSYLSSRQGISTFSLLLIMFINVRFESDFVWII